jgi:hypothetical protein
MNPVQQLITFINTLHSSNLTPLINGLSDHDAQLLMINEINLIKQTCHTKTIRNINKNSIKNSKLNYTTNYGIMIIMLIFHFNSCINSYLEMFFSSFPTENLIREPVKKPWITSEIEVMCQCKKAITEAKKSLV